jgi:hypothetical protein
MGSSGDQLADHGRTGDLTRDQQAAGGLGVGEEDQGLLAGGAWAEVGATQSRFRREPPGT